MSDTVESWCRNYILGADGEGKLDPPPPPTSWAHPKESLRIPEPGRPAEWPVRRRVPRSTAKEAIKNPRHRAGILRTFLHHEVQAAELMAWAILAFPDTPQAFRQGLLKILQDELRHACLYRNRIHAMGHTLEEFPIRDWFWTRVPQCQTPVQFVALMGMGLEGGNLDHTERFAALFREVGDEAGAQLQDLVGDEEVSHVAFAARWFRHWTGASADGGLDFERWAAELVPPLTPTMMQGDPVAAAARERAGLGQEFVTRLLEHRQQPGGLR